MRGFRYRSFDCGRDHNLTVESYLLPCSEDTTTGLFDDILSFWGVLFHVRVHIGYIDLRAVVDGRRRLSMTAGSEQAVNQAKAQAYRRCDLEHSSHTDLAIQLNAISYSGPGFRLARSAYPKARRRQGPW